MMYCDPPGVSEVGKPKRGSSNLCIGPNYRSLPQNGKYSIFADDSCFQTSGRGA
jgi:hypothetical protein